LKSKKALKKICINGLGRIGKCLFRIAQNNPEMQIVMVNEIKQNKNLAYNINYDSTYGSLEKKYEVEGDYLTNGVDKVFISHEKKVQNIDLKAFEIDILIDASGVRVDIEIFKQLSVEKVILTHPNKFADINMIFGVNEEKYDPLKDKVISASSCNATALLPVLKQLNEKFGIEYGDIVTVHPLLSHQKTLDSGCIGSSDREVECNFEFGRGAVQNIIPSHTTTIDACSLAIPFINSDLISSNSFRVPTDTVGAINLSITMKKVIQKEEVLELFKNLQEEQKFKIFYNNFDPLVSSDFKGSLFTSIIDHRFTDIIKNKMLKMVLWYDNEWGYASKVIEIINYNNIIKSYN
jgi:glyceraldehyde 3-phosphate dehydrogenase